MRFDIGYPLLHDMRGHADKRVYVPEPEMRKGISTVSLIDRVQQIVNGATILADWLGSGGIPVDKMTAQTRADCCLKCPLHDKTYSFTETAAVAIKTQVELKNHLRLRVDGEKSLHACGVCGCAMRLKIWLPIERIKPTPEERDKYDANCWLRKETE